MTNQIERKPLTKKTSRTRNSRQNARVSARPKTRGKARPASEGDEIVAEVSRFAKIGAALIKVTLPLLRAFGVAL